MSKNLTYSHYAVTKEDRQKMAGHKSFIIWITGLSGAGKSTLANALEKEFFKKGISSYVLDGDNIRHGLCKDLSFSIKDRGENIRRIGEVARLFVEAGNIVMTACISPFRADRDTVRQLVAAGEFVEVYLDCSLEVCEKRDPKGLYKKARSGEISNFTGIDSDYEAPLNPEVIIRSAEVSVEKSVEIIFNYLDSIGQFHF